MELYFCLSSACWNCLFSYLKHSVAGWDITSRYRASFYATIALRATLDYSREVVAKNGARNSAKNSHIDATRWYSTGGLKNFLNWSRCYAFHARNFGTLAFHRSPRFVRRDNKDRDYQTTVRVLLGFPFSVNVRHNEMNETRRDETSRRVVFRRARTRSEFVMLKTEGSFLREGFLREISQLSFRSW